MLRTSPDLDNSLLYADSWYDVNGAMEAETRFGRYRIITEMPAKRRGKPTCSVKFKRSPTADAIEVAVNLKGHKAARKQAHDHYAILQRGPRT